MKVSLFHTITSNTLYQAIGKAISIVLGLVITALLTRHLGQAGYGQYTLITTVIILFGSVTDWGSGFIATRMASKQEFPTDQVYGNLLILRIFMTVIGTLIMIAFGYFKIINLPLPLITLGSLVLFAMALHNSMQVIFQVQLKLQYGAIVGAVSSLAFLIFTILAVNQTTITPQSIILYLLISSTIAGLVGIYFGYRLTPIRYTLNPKLIINLIKESLPMGALLVVFSIYNRLDSFLLQYFQGDTAVGLYGLAYKIHDNLVMGAAFFMNALYPIIARSATPPSPLFTKEGVSSPFLKGRSGGVNGNTQRLYSTAFHLLLIVGLVISVTFFLLARPIVLLLGGPEFLESVTIIRILMLATFISYINHLTGYTLAALGWQRISLTIATGVLIVNIILNLIFIPIYSYYASAVITIVSEGIILIFTLSYLIHKQHLKPHLQALPSTIQNLLFNHRKLF